MTEEVELGVGGMGSLHTVKRAGSILIGDHYKMLLLAHSKLFTYLTAFIVCVCPGQLYLYTVLLTHIFWVELPQSSAGWFETCIWMGRPNWNYF